MGSLVAGMLIMFGGSSPLEITQIVAIYVTASLLVVALGMALERIIELAFG